MSARKFGVVLSVLGAASFCLWAAPALSGLSSPTPKVGAVAQSQSAPWQAKSGQIASGYPTASEAFRQLTSEWWQWVLSIPVAENPLLDQTGADCVVGQRGPVWFLVGNFGGGTTTRNCSIPEGKLLFFPVINSVNIDTPNVCGQGPERIPVADLRALSRAFINGAVKLSVVLDGKPLSKLARTRSKVLRGIFTRRKYLRCSMRYLGRRSCRCLFSGRGCRRVYANQGSKERTT